MTDAKRIVEHLDAAYFAASRACREGKVMTKIVLGAAIYRELLRVHAASAAWAAIDPATGAFATVMGLPYEVEHYPNYNRLEIILGPAP